MITWWNSIITTITQIVWFFQGGDVENEIRTYHVLQAGPKNNGLYWKRDLIQAEMDAAGSMLAWWNIKLAIAKAKRDARKAARPPKVIKPPHIITPYGTSRVIFIGRNAPGDQFRTLHR